MTGSGNLPPGRALRPEVRMNKEQEKVCQSNHTQSSPSLSSAPSGPGATAGSGSPGSTSSALVSEATQTEPGEAVMKRLTVEELAELQVVAERVTKHVSGTPSDMVWLKSQQALAILAMASRLVEVESALEFLAKDDELFDLWHEDIAGGEYFCADPHRKLEIGLSSPRVALLEYARVRGWTSPTQKQGDR